MFKLSSREPFMACNHTTNILAFLGFYTKGIHNKFQLIYKISQLNVIKKLLVMIHLCKIKVV